MLAEVVETVETWEVVVSRLVWTWPAECMMCRQEVEPDCEAQGEVVEVYLHGGKVCQCEQVGKAGVVW